MLYKDDFIAVDPRTPAICPEPPVWDKYGFSWTESGYCTKYNKDQLLADLADIEDKFILGLRRYAIETLAKEGTHGLHLRWEYHCRVGDEGILILPPEMEYWGERFSQARLVNGEILINDLAIIAEVGRVEWKGDDSFKMFHPRLPSKDFFSFNNMKEKRYIELTMGNKEIIFPMVKLYGLKYTDDAPDLICVEHQGRLIIADNHRWLSEWVRTKEYLFR